MPKLWDAGIVAGAAAEPLERAALFRARMQAAVKQQNARNELQNFQLMMNMKNARMAQKFNMLRLMQDMEEEYNKEQRATREREWDVQDAQTKHERGIEDIRARGEESRRTAVTRGEQARKTAEYKKSIKEPKSSGKPKPPYTLMQKESLIDRRAKRIASAYEGGKPTPEDYDEAKRQIEYEHEGRSKEPSKHDIYTPGVHTGKFSPVEGGQQEDPIQSAIQKAQMRLQEGAITQEQFDAFIAQLGR